MVSQFLLANKDLPSLGFSIRFKRSVLFCRFNGRTVPFERATVFDSAVKREQLLHRRLSLRYGPGSSIIPRGYGTELSVLWDESNGGRRADEVDGPWYPKVWPNTSDHELSQIKSLIENKLPVATSKRDSRIKEMQPYRKLKNRQVH